VTKLENKSIYGLIFLLALLVRAFYVLFFVSLDDLVIEDQMLYQALARGFLEEGWAALGLERLPLYSLFLSVFYRIADGSDALWLVLYAQAIFDAVTCVLIARLVFLVLGRGVLVAGLLAALNLNQIILAGMILTDSLYLFLMVLCLNAFVLFLKAGSKKALFFAALILGISALLRATSLHLVVLFSLFLFILGYQRIKFGSSLGHIKVFSFSVLIAAVFPTQVLLKNYMFHDTASYTSQTDTHLLNWIVPAAYQYGGLGSYQEGRNFAAEHLQKVVAKSPQDNESAARQASIQALMEIGIARVSRAWVTGGLLNLFAPSVAFAPALRDLPHVSFYETGGKGFLEKISLFLKDSSFLYVSLLVAGSVSSILFGLLALYGLGLAVLGKLPHRQIHLVLIGFALYFFVVTGPVIGTKYRLPVEPVLILLQVAALRHLFDWQRKRSSH
jgi:hypothetical protein